MSVTVHADPAIESEVSLGILAAQHTHNTHAHLFAKEDLEEACVFLSSFTPHSIPLPARIVT
jgi:hypothetical protein